jgi:hypothetical protein
MRSLALYPFSTTFLFAMNQSGNGSFSSELKRGRQSPYPDMNTRLFLGRIIYPYVENVRAFERKCIAWRLKKVNGYPNE